MAAENEITLDQVLDLIPQQAPFRFIDRILSADDETITATYTFRKDEGFYQGHFPGNPVTPGAILVETMAQTGVVAMGIYLLLKRGVPVSELKEMITLFAFADEIEFLGIVSPGETVIIHGQKIYLRKGNLKTRCSITRENGQMVCTGVLTGTGIKKR
jgi:3-hydroxyacyl-[acyl-carrier-protein] dehydratase